MALKLGMFFASTVSLKERSTLESGWLTSGGSKIPLRPSCGANKLPSPFVEHNLPHLNCMGIERPPIFYEGFLGLFEVFAFSL